MPVLEVPNRPAADGGHNLDATDNSFAVWLKERRDARGWDTQQLSAKSGVSQPLISMYERNLRKPKPDKVRLLAAALGAEVDTALLAAGYAPSMRDTPKPTDLATPKFIQTIRDEEFGEMTLRFYEGFIFNGKMVYVSSEYEFTNQQVIEAAVLLRAGMLKRA